MPNQIPDLVAKITDDVRSIIADEIALVRAEIKPAVRHLGIGGGLIGAASLFAVAVTIIFVFIVVIGFGWLYATTTSLSGWACSFFAALTAIGLLLIVAVVLVLFAKGSLSKVKPPSKVGPTVGAAFTAIKTGFADGQNRVLEEIGTPSNSVAISAPVGGSLDTLR